MPKLTNARSDKLLYPSAIDAGWYLTERVSSPIAVVDVLQKECGRRWIVLERLVDRQSERIKTPHYLREAIKRPEFKFVQSFQIHAVLRRDGVPEEDLPIDIYEFLGYSGVRAEHEFRMPILGKDAIIRGKPVK